MVSTADLYFSQLKLEVWGQGEVWWVSCEGSLLDFQTYTID